MPPFLNIVFPVRNEESRLEKGITCVSDYLADHGIDDYMLTIVDNDSSDSTQVVAKRLCEQYGKLHYLRIPEKGVGVAFRTAVESNDATIVGYMDIDLATDLDHLLEMIALFQNDPGLKVVNGSRWVHGYGSSGRGVGRVITSIGLTALLKGALGMKASDAICGFKFFRKEAASQLVREAIAVSEAAGTDRYGWFFIIEMLLIAERNRMKLYELPVHWVDDGCSSVDTVSVTKNYLEQISKLRKWLKA